VSRATRLCSLVLPLLATAAAGQDTSADPTALATRADVATQVAAMDRAMKPGQGFAWKPLVQSGATIAAIEIWKKPARPAVHPDQAEYATVVSGAGTLVSGGSLDRPTIVRADLTEGERIVGGTTRTLAPGDVVLIPAGVPHWFGITGKRLVLLGIKVPAAR